MTDYTSVQEWLSDIRSDLQEVLESPEVDTKGMRATIDGVNVSLTLLDQHDTYEISADADGDNEQILQEIRDTLATEADRDSPVGNDEAVDWVEVLFEADPNRIEEL